MSLIENKDRFIKTLFSVNRTGFRKQELMNYLEENKFFEIHSIMDEDMNFEGGLLIHSLSVLDQMRKINHTFGMNLQEDSIILTSLLHDVCCIDVNNIFPVGHGEKSVFILQRFINLTNEEIMAINVHLGHADHRSVDYNNFSCAFDISPLSLCLYMADMISSCYCEKRFLKTN